MVSVLNLHVGCADVAHTYVLPYMCFGGDVPLLSTYALDYDTFNLLLYNWCLCCNKSPSMITLLPPKLLKKNKIGIYWLLVFVLYFGINSILRTTWVVAIIGAISVVLPDLILVWIDFSLFVIVYHDNLH